MNYFKVWILVAFVTTALCGAIYIISQQILRQGLNDPQIQLAEDTATKINRGARPTDFDVSEKIDISKSLAPFLIIYDKEGKPVARTGDITGAIPIIPFGVLESAQKTGQNRVTWEPQKGVRIASVSVPYFVGGQLQGFVTAGRNMREVEKREGYIFNATFFVWVLTIVGTFILSLLFKKFQKLT